MEMIEQIGKYKHRIMSKLLSSNEIKQALVSTSKNFKGHPVPDNYKILYNHIYPYKRIPPVSDEQKTFITISIDDIRLVNKKFVAGFITFYIFTHTAGLMETAYGITRTDYIADQVHRIFNETRDLGIGQLEFSRMGDLEVNDYFFGVYLEYKNYDFN